MAGDVASRHSVHIARGVKMSTAKAKTRLIIPGLAGFYDSWRDISYTLVRVVIGGTLFMHGWTKVTVTGLAGVTAYMASKGLHPATAFAVAATILETIGAVCVLIGLFTRFFAAALAIELLIAFLLVHVHAGFAVGKGGFEYVLLLGIVMFAIAIRGGGPYSVDHMIGTEL